MRVSELDHQIHQMIRDDISNAVFAFCDPLTMNYPVCVELKPCIEKTVDYVENAMILFSGFKSETYGRLAATAKQMVRQEIATGRWVSMPEDEKEAGEIIAQRCFDDISKTSAVVEDPEHVYKVIGLYSYTASACNDGFDAWSFIRLFVYSWLIYYSEKISMPAVCKSADPQCVS